MTEPKIRPQCPACGAAAADWMLCKLCVKRLQGDLEQLPDLMRDLTLTFTRQTQTGTGNGGKGAETPVPFVDVDRRAVVDEVANTIGTWIRELDMGDFNVCRCATPMARCDQIIPSTLKAWCGWLLARVERIRGNAAAGEIADEIGHCVLRLRRLVDLPAEKVFCGACPICGDNMWARMGKDTVTCRRCVEAHELAEASDGERLPVPPPSYSVTEQRDRLKLQLQSRLATPKEILTAIPSIYGVEINSGTFRSWVSRGRIVAKGQRGASILYSVDEALTLAAEVASRAAAKATKGKRKVAA